MDKLVVSGDDFAPVLTEVLASGGTISIVVSGYSMSPFLKDGRDSATLRACTENDLRAGCILLFKRPDQALILHRVRRVLPDGRLVMNGDAQTWCETISADQVIGVVSDLERKGRRMASDGVWMRLWNLLWYPTRPVRPMLFQVGHFLLRRGKQSRSRGNK